MLLWAVLAGCGLLAAPGAGSASYDAGVKIALAPSPTSPCLPTPIPSPATIPLGQRSGPTNTALPTVAPTQGSKLELTSPLIKLDPEVITQGKVLVISIWAVPDLAITGNLDGQELIFVADGHHYWALLGVSLSDEIGMHTVWLKATNDRGQIELVTANFHVTGGTFPSERIDLPPGQLQLLDPALVEAENKDLQRRFGVFTTEKLWRGLFMIPIEGPISSAFGTQRSYNGGPISGHHQGIDIDAPEGSPVAAANDGVIVLAQRLRLRGNAIVINHGLGVFSGYYHMSEIEVAEGQSIKKGQIIGRVGETGMATGPHLHWEIRVRGTSVDPLEWIEREIGFGKIETDVGV